jgi:alpha-N-arabinofuranosidase
MDKYDPNKRVALVVDEWGNWFDVEPGTNPGFLYQQNTLRDALTAALTLNIFNNHAHRVRMANIAQTVNVLQAVILTNETSIVRTPTYHVFDLYQPHKEATLIPYALECADYEQDDQSIPTLSVSCSKSEDGKLNITLVNVDPTEPIDLNATIYGFEANKITGKSLQQPQSATITHSKMAIVWKLCPLMNATYPIMMCSQNPIKIHCAFATYRVAFCCYCI